VRLTLAILALGGLGGWGRLDLDCARGPAARRELDRTRLSEIEQAEDLAHASLEQALTGCPAGAAGGACRAEARRRSEVAWAGKKAEIEARYRDLRREFEARCASLLARETRPAPRGVPPSFGFLTGLGEECRRPGEDPANLDRGIRALLRSTAPCAWRGPGS
jgi:hypothetical protein